jgi:hypothetical protein
VKRQLKRIGDRLPGRNLDATPDPIKVASGRFGYFKACEIGPTIGPMMMTMIAGM